MAYLKSLSPSCKFSLKFFVKSVSANIQQLLEQTDSTDFSIYARFMKDILLTVNQGRIPRQMAQICEFRGSV